MKQLARIDCAILSLVLKRRWFEAIDREEKEEEFRTSNDYWTRRISNWELRANPLDGTRRPRIVEFRLGYQANAPRMAWIADWIERQGSAQTGSCEPVEQHFAIQLLERVELVAERGGWRKEEAR